MGKRILDGLTLPQQLSVIGDVLELASSAVRGEKRDHRDGRSVRDSHDLLSTANLRVDLPLPKVLALDVLLWDPEFAALDDLEEV